MRQAGVRSDIASLLQNLGYIALAQGDISQAAALFGEGLMLQREIGHQQGIAESLIGCAAGAAVRGQAEYSLHQAAQAQLPPLVWESARAAGQAMLLAQAIEEACAECVVSENAQYQSRAKDR
jgi:hypothetical protein